MMLDKVASTTEDLIAKIDIPIQSGSLAIEFKRGVSVVFIGANGSGKTRLGVFIDKELTNYVHRIAAHRSLDLNPSAVQPSIETAEQLLRYGRESIDEKVSFRAAYAHKQGHRWRGRPETAMLGDFDYVVAALHAEMQDVAVKFLQDCNADSLKEKPPLTKIQKLKNIWGTILPHRELIILAGNIKTRTRGENSNEYSAADMSDGERVIFYLIGQALLAKQNTILIFDEPELHINKAILNRLWDEIEAARRDCAFIYITHDVEFAASRHAALRYALRSYSKEPEEIWDIKGVPENTDIPDEIIAAILGSRKPVLFVEGDRGSLDFSLYRRIYSDFTVIPVGGCDAVIHTVNSFVRREELHRIGCAGIVDADGRTGEEAQRLEGEGIYQLLVSEVENIFLLPNVFLAIAKELKFEDQAAKDKLNDLISLVFEKAQLELDKICLRYTTRRVDAEVKKISLDAKKIDELDAEFKEKIKCIDPSEVFNQRKNEVSEAIEKKYYKELLFYYDNKGLFAEVARLLGHKKKALEAFIERVLCSDKASELHSALKSYLPDIIARP